MGPKAPDIAAGAMVREAQPVKPATPEQKLATQVADKMKERNYREGLSLAAEVRNRAPQQQKIDKKIEQIGTRDSNGKMERKSSSPEEGRYNRAKEGSEIARKFLTEGYDKLDSKYQEKVRNAVIAVARRNPLSAAEISNISADQAKLQAYAERWIKENPKYTAEITRNFDQWINSPEIVDLVTPLEDKVAELDFQKKEREYEVADVGSRLTDVNARLKDYERTATIKGPKATDLDGLKGQLPTLRAEADNFRARIDTINDRIEAIKSRSTTTEWSGRDRRERTTTSNVDMTDLKTAEDDLKKARDELKKREEKINRAEDLEQEEARLRQSETALDREKRQKDYELAKATTEWQRRTWELEDAKALRSSQEEDLASGIESIFDKAAEGVLDGQTEAFLQAADEEIAAFSEAAKEQNQKAVDKILQERYFKEVMRGKTLGLFGRGERRRAINRQHVDTDYAELMQSGPEAYMRKLLRNSNNPVTGKFYTDDEVNSLLQDKDYVENAQSMMIRYVMVQRMATSGISGEDIRVITSSSWGESIINDALNKNKEIKAQIEGVMGEGALQRHGFIDRLKADIKKNPALLLLLLLGIPAALVLGPGVGLVGGGLGWAGGTAAWTAGGAAVGAAGGAAAPFGARAAGISPEEEVPLAA